MATRMRRGGGFWALRERKQAARRGPPKAVMTRTEGRSMRFGLSPEGGVCGGYEEGQTHIGGWMPGNSLGIMFRINTFGESHGPGLGVLIDGVPPGIRLDLDRIQAELDRRRPGQSRLTSPRKEADRVTVLSGIFEERTLGTPIMLLVRNEDADARAYALTEQLYRPSHADYSYERKYGHVTWQGGGRASARETIGRVAAGAVARQVLENLLDGVEVLAWVRSVGELDAHVDPESVTAPEIEASILRCPCVEREPAMVALIDEARKSGDTVGGTLGFCARGVPAGLGEPVFDKLEAALGAALLSIPAARGIEFGAGFEGCQWHGSQHNDPFVAREGRVETRTNHSGGIQGGISNGMPIWGRIAFKPVATLFQDQDTVDRYGEPAQIKARGRHDPCVLPRAVPIVEAMICLVLCDQLLRMRGQTGRIVGSPLRSR
jgi:chorismate synthase